MIASEGVPHNTSINGS